MPETLNSWMLIALLGILNTAFAVTFYLKRLSTVKAQKAIVFTYLEPADAVVFGYFFLMQKPTFSKDYRRFAHIFRRLPRSI
ncbi:MAG: DMT family transporter [Candidatus Brockarchaeota archaeon]|nr:DMT family transporter [Candidatus Brockarchaeota archaeon]